MKFYYDDTLDEYKIPTPGELFETETDKVKVSQIVKQILKQLETITYCKGEPLNIIFNNYSSDNYKYYKKAAKLFEEKGWRVYLEVDHSLLKFIIWGEL